MLVSLVPVTSLNRSECLALSVATDQTHLIATNEKSLRQADADPTLVPLAIVSNDRVVGFAMYHPREEGRFSIHRLMIDERFQRCGYGKAAMIRLIEDLRAQRARLIDLSFRPDNIAARKLYEQLGFVFQEEEADGEQVYRLPL